MKYDIIVVGGGHAGCEASLACARMGKKTLLITSNIKNIADMPCNPSIGGPAKGIVVREIDALGGEMAHNTDISSLQMKMLNTKKGPAVRALRAQVDKIVYKENMLKTIQNTKNLDILEKMVEDLLIKDSQIYGIKTSDKIEIYAKAIILTTGTYLKGTVLCGSKKIESGPHGEKPSLYLSENLKKIGFNIKRLKTGTPPRIAKETIDFSNAELQPGDPNIWNFSYYEKTNYDIEKQLPCYLIYTTSKTHKIIKENLNKSSMYGGYVEGVGPRYCPSIEDKIVRFADKERHQLFLEPESIYYDDIYLQGFSTSMPHDIQEQMVHSLKGLENAKITKYAYAIEYDAIDSLQLKRTLETKIISNLFTAGQINGTSGYEEAAAQGLIAGINAVRKIDNNNPLILKRNESYIGVLIDDLVTKGVLDPYRLLTSRAEYRLLLRHDNADLRLSEYGHEIGLLSDNKYQIYLNKIEKINQLKQELKLLKLNVTDENQKWLQSINSSKIYDGITLYDLLKRPEVTIQDLNKKYHFNYDEDILEQVAINIKYNGYIEKEQKEVNKMLEYENIKIPDNIDYQDVHNLAAEAKQKLELIKPTTIAQASRISGVNPADISMLLLYLKRGKNE